MACQLAADQTLNIPKEKEQLEYIQLKKLKYT